MTVLTAQPQQLSERPERTGANVTGPEPVRAHFPGLDGLRGSAAIAVILCHFAVFLPKDSVAAYVLGIGWTGVDLFFVLSGFLITGILWDAKGSPHYFRNFYARRTLRIFPLYYGFLVAMLIASKFATSDVQQFRDAQPWLWTYTANYWFSTREHWSPWAEAVVHLWSLSVEEQFYLVWPVVVWYFSRRNLIRLCVLVMLGALAVRLWFTARGMDGFVMYTWTPTRADSLAAGAIVALLLRGPGGERFVRRVVAFGGAIGFVLLAFLLPAFDPTKHPWRATVIYTDLALICTALVFWSTDARSLWGIPKRFYELRGLRIIGRYSYGLYVLHLPLMYAITFAAHRWGLHDPNHATWRSGLAMMAVSAALTFAAAVVSFHAFEQPLLRLKRYIPEGRGSNDMPTPGVNFAGTRNIL